MSAGCEKCRKLAALAAFARHDLGDVRRKLRRAQEWRPSEVAVIAAEAERRKAIRDRRQRDLEAHQAGCDYVHQAAAAPDAKPGTKVTADQAAAMRERRAAGESARALADEFAVSTATVLHHTEDVAPRFIRTDEPWMADALCAQTDPEAFFPEKGGSVAAAKATCGRCEVREQCLEYALRTRPKFGVWGGLTERELRRERRRLDDEATATTDTPAASGSTPDRRGGGTTSAAA